MLNVVGGTYNCLFACVCARIFILELILAMMPWTRNNPTVKAADNMVLSMRLESLERKFKDLSR